MQDLPVVDIEDVLDRGLSISDTVPALVVDKTSCECLDVLISCPVRQLRSASNLRE